MAKLPTVKRNQTRNLQKIAVRMVDGSVKSFCNSGGWSTYDEIKEEIKQVKGIATLLVEVTGVRQ